MIEKDKIQSLLNELGSSIEEIAINLSLKDCKGDCNSGDTCPIANFLEKELNFEYRLNVQSNSLRISNLEQEQYLYILHTNIIRNFIELFDSGEFPELIKF